MKKNLLKILTIVLVFLPLFASAALNLENAYPTVPGTQISLTGDSTLGETIKYFSSWAIFIGAIVAFIALIYAGLLYLSSIGRPAVMNEAQNRIYKSFLGLAILLGSYIILIVINPQLIVMRANKEPVVSGVILLTDRMGDGTECEGGWCGWKEFENLPDKKSILAKVEELASRTPPDAYYLSSAIKDCQKIFGELILEDTIQLPSPMEANFANFKIKAVGFIGDGSGEETAKIIAYQEPNFKKLDVLARGNYEYLLNGRIGINTETEKVPPGVSYGAPIGAWSHLYPSPQNFFIGITELASFTKSEVTYFDPDTGTHPKDSIFHPPLSFEPKNIWPGAYLYTNKIGEERYIGSDEVDLSNIDFDDSAKRVEVRNGINKEKDFLAVLYEEEHFYGEFRMFFEKDPLNFRERYIPNASDLSDPTGGTWDYKTATQPGEKEGNLEMYERKLLNDSTNGYIDQYGKVKKPSSVQVFNLDAENPTTCKEVRVCTKPDFLGSCIVYTPLEDGKIRTVDREEGVFLATSSVPATNTALPIYTPKNIKNMAVTKLSKDGTKVSGEPKDEKFIDNINSIKITGNCLVALFQNAVDENVKPSEKNTEKFWDKKTPGNHSQIFTESQNDLSHTEICRCGILTGFGLFRYGDSCASAIAIYPIK